MSFFFVPAKTLWYSCSFPGRGAKRKSRRMNDQTVLAGVMAGALFGGLFAASMVRDREEAHNKGTSRREEKGKEKEEEQEFESPFIGALDQGTSSTRFII